MDKLGFLFLAILYLLVSILSFVGSLDFQVQLAVCGFSIAIVGIPHGAIDNLLFLKNSNVTPLRFYVSYLFSMALYLLVWMTLPAIALAIFLLISAYHFGESQFTKYVTFTNIHAKILYFAWGSNILSAMIFYNNIEIMDTFSKYSDLEPLLFLMDSGVHYSILILSTVYLFLAFVFSLNTKKIKLEYLFKEIYTLLLIHVAFLVLPLLVGFTLYFVVLHSTSVLIDEYKFLQLNTKSYTIAAFLKQLFPFTAISILGGFIILLAIQSGLLQMSYLFVSIILIALITLPHSVVMHKFYHR